MKLGQILGSISPVFGMASGQGMFGKLPPMSPMMGLLSMLGGHGFLGQGGEGENDVTGLQGAGADFLQRGGMGGQPGQQSMNFLGSLSNPQNMRMGGPPGLTQLTGLGQGMRY